MRSGADAASGGILRRRGCGDCTAGAPLISSPEAHGRWLGKKVTVYGAGGAEHGRGQEVRTRGACRHAARTRPEDFMRSWGRTSKRHHRGPRCRERLWRAGLCAALARVKSRSLMSTRCREVISGRQGGTRTSVALPLRKGSCDYPGRGNGARVEHSCSPISNETMHSGECSAELMLMFWG